MRKLTTNLSLLTLLLLLGCKATSICSTGEMGVLKDLSGLDGCGWVIELNDGKKLQPINLDKFNLKLEDNKAVQLKYHPADMMAGICMAGDMVELDCISFK